MQVLCMDTANTRVSVAFGLDGEVLGEVALVGGRRHAEQLAPAIQYLRDELGVDLHALAAIGVGIGPGLYTGLRVGVTTAKVMAQALRIPIVPVPSLDLVAFPLRHARRLVVAITDARRKEVFHASYRPVPGGVQRVGGYEVSSPDDLAADLEATGEEVLLAGDGTIVHRHRFESLERVELAGPSSATPGAAALVELASARFEREEFSPPWEVHPMYLRKSDAEIEWDRRGIV